MYYTDPTPKREADPEGESSGRRVDHEVGTENMHPKGENTRPKGGTGTMQEGAAHSQNVLNRYARVNPTRTYSRVMHSQNSLRRNRIPYYFHRSAYSTCGAAPYPPFVL